MVSSCRESEQSLWNYRRRDAESLSPAELALDSGAVPAAGLRWEQRCRRRRYQHSHLLVSPRFWGSRDSDDNQPGSARARGPPRGLKPWVPSLPPVTISVREQSSCHFRLSSKVRHLPPLLIPPSQTRVALAQTEHLLLAIASL